MILVHKILPSIFYPIFITLITIIIGIKLNNRKVLMIAFFILYIFSTPLFANKLFKIIEGTTYKTPLLKVKKADAIVVLSGMMTINELADSIYIDWINPDRYLSGIKLYKESKANLLIFTKAKMPWNKNTITEGDILKKLAIENGIKNNSILITTNIVENTEDEAIEIKKLLKNKKEIILITSAFHMYRAKEIFEDKGFKVIPFKTDFKISRFNQNLLIDLIPNGRSINLSEIAIKEIFGIMYYKLKNLYCD